MCDAVREYCLSTCLKTCSGVLCYDWYLKQSGTPGIFSFFAQSWAKNAKRKSITSVDIWFWICILVWFESYVGVVLNPMLVWFESTLNLV